MMPLSVFSLMRIYFHWKACLLQACFLFLAITFTAAFSFGQPPKTQYKITGHTSQKEGKAKLLLYTSQRQFIPYDSSDIKDGVFFFKGILNEPKSFQLLIGSKGRILFVGNENITVDDRNGKGGAITVSGSKLSDDYDYYFNRWIAPLINRAQIISQKLDSLDVTHQNEIDSLTSIQNTLFNGVPDSSADFIREKPFSFVSLYLLNSYIDSFNKETVTNLYSRLDASLKQYPSAQLIRNKIQGDLQVSAKCPPFSVTDEKGRLLTLQSFNGAYLLIHFWANNNTASAKNIPFVQKAADRFQHRNFNVLTVSLDTDTSQWKAALQQYRLSERCQNAWLPNQFGNPMAIQFGLTFLPRTILVDPGGNIIANDIAGEKINQYLEKIFTVSVNGDDDVAMLP